MTKIKEENYSKGRGGEKEAKEYLIKLGYEPILDNYRNELGEIDLIMRVSEWLVFVEVKYKSDDSLGFPEEMIDKRKLAQVKRVAQLFILEEKSGSKFEKYRIDAVCILGKEIRHYVNIDA